MKEFQVQLELAKIASQELGKFLADAFMNGKFAVEQFIASLIQAIAQMAILRAISAGFLGGGGAASAVTAIPAAILGKRSTQVIVVGGEISMDKNKFVVQLNKAQASQFANYGVGNGNLYSP